MKFAFLKFIFDLDHDRFVCKPTQKCQKVEFQKSHKIESNYGLGKKIFEIIGGLEQNVLLEHFNLTWQEFLGRIEIIH